MKKNWKTSSRFLGWILIGASSVGLLASFTLLHETFELAKNPSYNPTCNINVFIGCKSAMASKEADILFGIPNPAYGIAAFSALFVFGVLVLAGTAFKPWIWLAGVGAAGLGLLGCVFLYLTSLFSLGMICPWCFATWVITIATFWALVTHAVAADRFSVPTWLQRAKDRWLRYSVGILVAIYFLLIFGILVHFNQALF